MSVHDRMTNQLQSLKVSSKSNINPLETKQELLTCKCSITTSSLAVIMRSDLMFRSLSIPDDLARAGEPSLISKSKPTRSQHQTSQTILFPKGEPASSKTLRMSENLKRKPITFVYGVEWRLRRKNRKKGCMSSTTDFIAMSSKSLPQPRLNWRRVDPSSDGRLAVER